MPPYHALLLVVALAGAGCLESGKGAGPGADADDGTWRLGGTFTRNATQADITDFGDRMESRGATVAVMESFPMQFAASGFPSRDACEKARAEALTLGYVAVVGNCSSEAPSGEDPEAPTSNGQSGSGA